MHLITTVMDDTRERSVPPRASSGCRPPPTTTESSRAHLHFDSGDAELELAGSRDGRPGVALHVRPVQTVNRRALLVRLIFWGRPLVSNTRPHLCASLAGCWNKTHLLKGPQRGVMPADLM